MKKILLVIMLLIGMKCYSQQPDSTYTMEQLSRGMQFMKMNFDKSHKQFTTGLTIVAGGAVVAGMGFIMNGQETPSYPEGDKKVRNGFFIAGGVIALIGTVVMIDSHKYIGRAGRWQFTGDSISLSLK